MRDALAVEQIGHFVQRSVGQLAPHPADDRGLLWHDLQLAGMDEATRRIAQTAVSERVVPALATVLEQPSLHPGHPLGVEVALELGGKAELPEHEASRRPVELGVRQVGHEERDLLALELVEQVEHEAGVAGQARQVVHDDR